MSNNNKNNNNNNKQKVKMNNNNNKASAPAQSPAVKRLLQDLKQLKEEPILGVSAEPFGDDLMTWYGIVLGVEGTPYAGIPLRFSLEFSSNYPKDPPNAYFDTTVAYEGGAAYRDASGRLVVCLNIFGNFSWIHTEWANQSEGWSPSYTVQTILLSMQALMLGDMLSTHEYDIERMAESALNFKCPITGHVGSDKSKWFPAVITDQKMIESITKASGRVAFDPLRDFYICYSNKSTASGGAALGYGIHVENPKNGTLSSPCEYLSWEAFENGTKRSSTNLPFEYWLPVLIHSNQWPRIRRNFITTVAAISRSFYNFTSKDSTTATQVFKVCSSIMNSLVVEIMNNEDNVTANDKFINGYLSFYRLLVEYSKEDKSIIRLADKELRTFIASPDRRAKPFVPNLGELLIYLLISSKYSWADLAQPFIEECDARNVLWYVTGNRDSQAKCPELISEKIVAGRSAKVFPATKVSRNLVMFQVRFSKVAKGLNPDIMDANLGLAPDDLRYELKDVYNLVSSVGTWNAYFDWLDMPAVGERSRDLQLLNALKLSRQRRYHRPDGQVKYLPPARQQYFCGYQETV